MSGPLGGGGFLTHTVAPIRTITDRLSQFSSSDFDLWSADLIIEIHLDFDDVLNISSTQTYDTTKILRAPKSWRSP